MSKLEAFDHYLADEGPAALCLREPLMPVEGRDGVLFPATFASGDGFPGGYNIDTFSDDSNVCLIDSVGSQANRIEPMFEKEKYRSLVPQLLVVAGDRTISIFQAGHRAGDALVRASELKVPLQQAFQSLLRGDALPLAKLAPTSLVFGVWDSRDTQAKIPRLIASTIRAFNVRRLTRSAQFVPATEYVREGLLDEPADKATKDAYAERGFIHVPAAGSPGGVIASGGIRREATLSLAALRQLNADADARQTMALQRYILGLALTAFTFPVSPYLRQGCQLVLDPGQPRELVEVYPNGERKPLALTHDDALAFAQAAAKSFGVDPGRTVAFDRELAKKDVSGEGDTKTKAKSKKGKKSAAETEDQS